MKLINIFLKLICPVLNALILIKTITNAMFICDIINYQAAFCGCLEVTPIKPIIQIWHKVPRLKAGHLVRRIVCALGQSSPPEWTELGPKFRYLTESKQNKIPMMCHLTENILPQKNVCTKNWNDQIFGISPSCKGPFFYCHEECHFTWHCHFTWQNYTEMTVSGEMTLFVTVEKWTLILGLSPKMD